MPPVRVRPYRRHGRSKAMPFVQRRVKRSEGLRMVQHPGKFEGELEVSEILWEASMDWGADGIGDVQDFGYYQRIDFDKDIVKDLEGPVQAKQLTPEERKFLRSQAGAIFMEDNVGFVRFEYYDTKAELDKAWDKIEADYEEFMEGAEEF